MPENGRPPVDPEVEGAHQQKAAQTDLLVDQLLGKLRDLGLDDRAILTGTSAAMTRFTMNSLVRAGNAPLPSNVLGRLMRLIQFAAERILKDAGDDPPNGRTFAVQGQRPTRAIRPEGGASDDSPPTGNPGP